MKIAVYGTLKKGRGNHGFLNNCEFIGEGITKEKYGLYAMGIPYVVSTESICNVAVEVYEVPEGEILDRVDGLEGHPNYYERRPVTIVLSETGEEIEAQLYFNDRVNTSSLKCLTSGSY